MSLWAHSGFQASYSMHFPFVLCVGLSSQFHREIWNLWNPFPEQPLSMEYLLLPWAAKHIWDPVRVRSTPVLAPVLPSFPPFCWLFLRGLVNFKKVFKMQELLNFVPSSFKNRVDRYRAGSKRDAFLLISAATALRLLGGWKWYVKYTPGLNNPIFFLRLQSL